MSLLLGWLSKYLWAGATVAALGLVLALGVQTHRLAISKAETVEVQNLRTLEKAQATQVALDAETKALAKEAADATKLKEVQDAYTALQTTHTDALAAQRVALADNGRLRTALAAYASGSGQVGPDSIAASNQRAAALGALLATALQADAEHASAAEANGDGIRALLAAWPHDDESISLPKMKLGG